ncbi:S-adenosyl-L-methionine-dependent methyltransferase [Biscogniauxia marginata]|nr:S-adenosyl-L-methionine-dependent methyltransferase [Biscogniauxia marginata]
MPALTKAQRKQVQAAEDSFNRTYAMQYGEERWQQTLYPALVAPTRYAALINRYATTGVPEAFAEDEAKELESIHFPGHGGSSAGESLTAYQRGTPEAEAPFPPPQMHPSNRLMTHWNLDAASLLAVTVLDPQPGDKVLDICAAPGGKSVALAQLLRAPSFDASSSPSLAGGCLHSNEVNSARNRRLASNLEAYLPAPLFKSGEVRVLKLDASDAGAVHALPLGPGGYDKVLLDAPCSSERHVVHSPAHARGGLGSWRSGQSRKLARAQAALLLTALRAVRVGGRVLYATCSLSGEENDGVVDRGVEMAAAAAAARERRKKKEVGNGGGGGGGGKGGGGGGAWGLAVRSASLEGAGMERWAERTRHGWLVLPDHPGGGRWGPLYFALLEKVAI